MPASCINKHADLCIEKTKIYTPLIISLLGLFGIGISLIIQGSHILMGTLLVSFGLITGGISTSVLFNEIGCILWAHKQASTLIHKDTSLFFILDIFPEMKNLFYISLSFVIIGILVAASPIIETINGIWVYMTILSGFI